MARSKEIEGKIISAERERERRGIIFCWARKLLRCLDSIAPLLYGKLVYIFRSQAQSAEIYSRV